MVFFVNRYKILFPLKERDEQHGEEVKGGRNRMIKVKNSEKDLFCDKCNKYVEYELKEQREVFEVRGEEIEITSTSAYCKTWRLHINFVSNHFHHKYLS